MVVWKQERANSPQRKVARQGKCCAFPSALGSSEVLVVGDNHYGGELLLLQKVDIKGIV